MTTHRAVSTLATFAAVLALAGPAGASVIAHYSFDADFTDSSASGNDLSVGAGSPAITTAADRKAFGAGAADFASGTGDEYFLSMASTITFGADDAWSVSFWARRNSGADVASGMIVGNADNNNDFIWLPQNVSVCNGLRFRNTGGVSYDYKPIVDDNEFHHWVVIADGLGHISVYRDGEPLGPLNATTAISINAVGQAYNGNKQSMNGQIDELWIFDTAIGTTTVHNLYATNTVPEPATLLVLLAGGTAVLLKRRTSRN